MMVEAGGTENIVNIAIIATSDLHGNIWGYRYEDNTETANDGMARVATYVQEVRKSGSEVILIDNGDLYQGNILTDDVFNKQPDVVHPVSQVLNAMKYDAMTLGNHDFNFGLDLVHKCIRELDFPVLAANASYISGESFAESYTIVEVQGIKIAIVGLTNPNVPRWDGDKVKELCFSPMDETALELVTSLKADGLADIVIVSAHAGMVAEFDEEGGSDSAECIATRVPGTDVLVVGHMHIPVKERIGDTIIGGPRNLGREVVRFDLTVQLDGRGPTIVGREVSLIDMGAYAPDPDIRALVQGAHEETITFVENGGGASSDIAGGGILGQATADFQPQEEIRGISEWKLRDTAIVKLIQKAMLQYSGADVVATTLFSDRADLKQGDITYGNIYSVYPFDNLLYVVTVTGKELKAYMEVSAAHYNQWKEGDLSISFDPEVPGYLYDLFAGINYGIDLSKPAGERIVDVMFEGRPLTDTEELQLAVNNYRYSSLLKASKLVSAKKHWESPGSIRDYLVECIRERQNISPEIDNNWSIVGIDLSSPYREEVIRLVNEGKLDPPHHKSLNVNEMLEAGWLQRME
ncbi:bifunctional metallophosphatase/5'-nucleotidase [Paenibacillus sp. GCM10012306]|uniref:bifunctional metallophosphatase/5'-nucleotidase n=1 Tax=Paenibacillus sp. GCM10012306 TaxID=3317342 RepID=UPI00361FE819